MRIAVLGAGGIGGLMAALLARDGNAVVVVAREPTARALADRGIRLESARFGNFTVRVESCTTLEDEVDFCLLAVKNTQLRQALERVPAAALGKGLVVPFMNGIDHVEALRTTYGATRVLPAIIRVESSNPETGLIHQGSPFASVEIAARANDGERAQQLATTLETAGFDVRVREDEAAMLWGKLAFLGPFALLTAHGRENAEAVRTSRRQDAIAVIEEVAAIAEAEGVKLDPKAVLAFLDSVPPSMESSMQRDQAAGRAMEIDAIGGALLRRADRARVAVPVTRRIVDELRLRDSSRS